MSIHSENNSKSISKKYLLKNAVGVSAVLFSVVLFLSFISYFQHWKEDQSQLEHFYDKTETANNVFGKLGALLGDFFILNFVGIAAFCIPLIILLFGLKLIFRIKRIKLFSILFHLIFFLIWIPLFLGLILPKSLLLQGLIGYETNLYLKSIIGLPGIAILLLLGLCLYLIFEWKITPNSIQNQLKKEESTIEGDTDETIIEQPSENKSDNNVIIENENLKVEKLEENKSTVDFTFTDSTKEKIEESKSTNEIQEVKNIEISNENKEEELTLKIESAKPEEIIEKPKNIAVEEFGEYDPRLELSGFQTPTLELLKSYDAEGQVTIDQKELEANKNRIVETLGNYGINIAQIKATIGPTVTLYEIVPEAGVRISKIKNLEDDIALSLSALGIRIIAPIPGKGTIGIEVPNTHTSVVSMHSVIGSQKFQGNNKMELPIAFGKTISNETFVTDLAKMPHLLMAGATGQGKSVGLNTIITSLLYKKHPAELKFVFVDPKKVELTLYNKIERHYLAKLPDSEEAIITDNTKVINTLNSLCIEMDDRYELLKNAYVRNIKEYNNKFKQRKLNPEKGHRFLPYIVLVVDEFADLIMTAGKEVELPIARLAQLARAIGIHLIIATQRPSVNVITGMIKANFPARVAFRVTSKIDSRTILDSGGADQLIGKGDMLFTRGNDLIRLQCAFVDTPEVEEITEFIGNQKGYPDALLLPEYVGEESSALDVDLSERDKLFEEAAKVVVIAQQGSASLLQRKLKLGYNRAGRIIDQLEAAGVVGPFEGSKARQVLVTDELSLEQLLNNLDG